MEIAQFRVQVYTHYKTNGRHDLPWRPPALKPRGIHKELDPYAIAVSEIMLQQTQVPRVRDKYKAFLKQFPTVQKLADAPLSAVLQAWSGLGYNRRAKFLKQMAEAIMTTRQGTFPKTKKELQELPGIGPYTAGAIAAFAYNQPVVFIETNIRTVFIHHFFKHKKAVSDAAIQRLVEKTLDTAHPREWYWALMDYGSYLKQNGNVLHRKSTQYVKQSSFIGSRRQVRGAILKAILTEGKTIDELVILTKKDEETVNSVLADLIKESLVQKRMKKFRLEN